MQKKDICVLSSAMSGCESLGPLACFCPTPKVGPPLPPKSPEFYQLAPASLETGMQGHPHVHICTHVRVRQSPGALGWRAEVELV